VIVHGGEKFRLVFERGTTVDYSVESLGVKALSQGWGATPGKRRDATATKKLESRRGAPVNGYVS